MAQERQEESAKSLSGTPIMTADIATLAQQIKSEGSWKTAPRASRVVANLPPLRVVLHVMHVGAATPVHRAAGPISVFVISGRIQFRADDHTAMLTAGQMLTLESGRPHAVEAPEDAVFLVTVAVDRAMSPS